MIDHPIIQILDDEERRRYDDSHTGRSRGRPSVVDEGRFSLEDLKKTYQKLQSVKKVALHYGVSPTTVKKYLAGHLKKPGRPPQPQAWKLRHRSPIHAWFVQHRDKRLPNQTSDLSRLSGFSVRRINLYLNKRRKATQEYLKTLPEPYELDVIYVDILDRKIPPIMIDQYTVSVDKFNLDLIFSFVLVTGGLSTVVVPFLKYIDLCHRKRNPGSDRAAARGAARAGSSAAPGVSERHLK